MDDKNLNEIMQSYVTAASADDKAKDLSKFYAVGAAIKRNRTPVLAVCAVCVLFAIFVAALCAVLLPSAPSVTYLGQNQIVYTEGGAIDLTATPDDALPSYVVDSPNVTYNPAGYVSLQGYNGSSGSVGLGGIVGEAFSSDDFTHGYTTVEGGVSSLTACSAAFVLMPVEMTASYIGCLAVPDVICTKIEIDYVNTTAGQEVGMRCTLMPENTSVVKSVAAAYFPSSYEVQGYTQYKLAKNLINVKGTNFRYQAIRVNGEYLYYIYFSDADGYCCMVATTTTEINFSDLIEIIF